MEVSCYDGEKFLWTRSMNFSDKSVQMHVEKFEKSNSQFSPFSKNRYCNPGSQD